MVSISKMLSVELKIISVPLIVKRKANKVKAEWKGELRKTVFGESSHRE